MGPIPASGLLSTCEAHKRHLQRIKPVISPYMHRPQRHSALGGLPPGLMSSPFSTVHLKKSQGSLVAPPWAKRGCLKSCAVPQSTFLPVSFCRWAASSTTLSSMALLSAKLAPSGAMSLCSQEEV